MKRFKLKEKRWILNRPPVEKEPEIYHKARVALVCGGLPLLFIVSFVALALGVKPRGFAFAISFGSIALLLMAAMVKPQTKIFWTSFTLIFLYHTIGMFIDLYL